MSAYGDLLVVSLHIVLLMFAVRMESLCFKNVRKLVVP